MYDASGMKYTPESWAAEQARGGAAYLFRGGGGQDVSSGGRNPWMKDSWDDMEQVRVYRESSAKAEALAKEVGSRIGALRPS